ncbi:MAG: thioredoxin family protein [Candidatus Sumerlaea chitinivorans]|nr:thioredoxin family protein [Candidatus Sumerlaea chitinivorans]
MEQQHAAKSFLRVVFFVVFATAFALRLSAQSAAPAYTPPPSVEVKPQPDGTYQVTFKYQSAASRVFLAGSFNDWATNKDEMQRYGNLFYTTINLPEGIHEYKFVEEGTEWVLDPLNMDRVDNGLGSKNNVLRLGRNIAAPSALPPALTRATTAPVASGLQWFPTIEAARQSAAQTGKRILLFFYMPGSKSSDYYEQVFADPVVTQVLREKYVLVRLNFMEKNKLAYQLGVFRAGIMNIYDSTGAPLMQIAQRLSPTELAEKLK